MRRKKKVFRFFGTILALICGLIFIYPTIVTLADSFMSSTEINAHYGKVFESNSDSGDWWDMPVKDTTYKNEKVFIKIKPNRVTLSQYADVLFKSPEYLFKFWNSVKLTVPILVFQILVALGASYSFARFTGRLKEIMFFVYIILMLMPYQVTLVPNFIVAQTMGTIETYWSIILPGIFSPFSVFILTKYMRRIPSSYTEAAKIDGAGEWQIFTKIYVPLCKGTIVSVALLIFIDYWNMVEQPLIMLSDKDKHPLSVFLAQINQGEVGLAFAVASVYMIPCILLFLYCEEYLVEGIAYSGGLKG
ncbi:MAG: carbohydrate ABC transporter permease [Lachnospiraceae bacterium]|nr:carbohydrate ABC transporter permease [Lachnospiraceae bacterium]